MRATLTALAVFTLPGILVGVAFGKWLYDEPVPVKSQRVAARESALEAAFHDHDAAVKQVHAWLTEQGPSPDTVDLYDSNVFPAVAVQASFDATAPDGSHPTYRRMFFIVNGETVVMHPDDFRPAVELPADKVGSEELLSILQDYERETALLRELNAVLKGKLDAYEAALAPPEAVSLPTACP